MLGVVPLRPDLPDVPVPFEVVDVLPASQEDAHPIVESRRRDIQQAPFAVGTPASRGLDEK
eukprot:CAMPEP_0197189260 /NCGR_PEP_ID=MMETSP1423-20130617/19467_1 /TAXON_ID=476441 /ORGANISM="Pseudo-nitzschia heimii, Strain UNC1101" /LENGTH=60 /DNA_ID=CAMNT_0042641319 /DNA_START=402 /DNA_END=581 /DNA_ORIENTATION=-